MSYPLKRPLVYLITPGEATAADFQTNKLDVLKTIKSAVDDGISLIQIRERELPARLLFDLAKAAAAVVAGTGAKLLVNDRADIALASGADGVHLPARSVPADILRRALPDDYLIGASVHSFEEVAAARSRGANFVVYGPVFDTPGKGKSTGLRELELVCAAADEFPVIAVGGLSDANYESVLAAGAAGLAAIRALNNDESRHRILAGLRADPATSR